MQDEKGAKSREERFIAWLMSLVAEDQEKKGGSPRSRAILAALRRGIGKAPGTVLEVYPYLMPFIAPSEEQRLERYATVAALMAMHPLNRENGNLGTSLAEIRKDLERGGAGATSIERRFIALLNCHSEDLPKHLRHVVSLAKSKNVPINWVQLLSDLKYWGSPNRAVQRRWAREFWAGYDPAAEAPDGNPDSEREDENEEGVI